MGTWSDQAIRGERGAALRRAVWLILTLAALALLVEPLVPGRAQSGGGGRIEGVATCAGSTCHGRA